MVSLEHPYQQSVKLTGGSYSQTAMAPPDPWLPSCTKSRTHNFESEASPATLARMTYLRLDGVALENGTSEAGRTFPDHLNDGKA
jgi:hypothetical protein